MDHKQFDDKIKQQLEQMDVSFDPASWSMLEKKMARDAALNKDTSEHFDEVVQEKLNQVPTPHRAAHWRLMAERIRKEFSWREKLVRYKVVEAALMLLAIITLLQYLPVLRNEADMLQNEKLNAEHTVEKNTEYALPQATNSPPVRNTSKTAIEPTEKNAELIASNKWNIENSDTENHQFSQPDFIENKEIVPVRTSRSDPNKNSDLEMANASIERAVSAINTIEPASDVDLELSEVNALQQSSRFRVSMFSSMDYDYIKTPYDEIFQLPEYGRYAPGYGGGITFGMKIGKWEIETGGVYAAKEYQPRIPTEIIGSLARGFAEVRFDNIQLNTLEVPLNLRYEFGQIQKWRFYGQTGASLHLAMQANYDRFPSNLDNLLSRQAIEGSQPKLEQKKFPDGLLEGGNFEENSYFTANLGVGVEHLLSTRWSLFLQPSVQAYLLPSYNNGLGPNQDRLNSFSILTGARVTLW